MKNAAGNRPCIIYYHGNDWAGMPGRQQRLMQAMTAYARVVYLDGGIDRKWRVSARAVEPDVTVVRGLAAALGGFDRNGMGAAARMFAAYHLRPLLRGAGRVIVWCSENWLRPHRFLRHDALVYDNMDPPFSEDPAELKKYDLFEREIATAADVVFATAEALAGRCRPYRPDVRLLNNACEPRDYAPGIAARLQKPAWWRDDGRPVMGFWGSLDWRVDFDLLDQVVAACPQITFVLAGFCVKEFEARVAALAGRPNVIRPGKISTDEGQFLFLNMTAGIIPYIPGKKNESINPIKLYGHALLGKPTVGTALPELVARPRQAITGNTSEAFVAAIHHSIELAADAAYVEALKQFGRENTWADRARVAAECLGLAPAAAVAPAPARDLVEQPA